MLICLGKDWNDDHNDSLKGKRNVPSYILGDKIKIIRINLISVIDFIGLIRK